MFKCLYIQKSVNHQLGGWWIEQVVEMLSINSSFKKHQVPVGKVAHLNCFNKVKRLTMFSHEVINFGDQYGMLIGGLIGAGLGVKFSSFTNPKSVAGQYCWAIYGGLVGVCAGFWPMTFVCGTCVGSCYVIDNLLKKL